MSKVGFEPTKHNAADFESENKVIAVRKNIVQIYKALVHKVLFPNPGIEPGSSRWKINILTLYTNWDDNRAPQIYNIKSIIYHLIIACYQ